MSYRALLSVDTSALRNAAAAWRVLAAATESRWHEIADAITTMGDAWRGPAASAANRNLSAASDTLESTTPTLVALDQTLTWYADRLEAAQNMLLAAADIAAGTGIRVSLDGAVLATGAAPSHLSAVLQAQVGIRAAIDLASFADTAAAARLAELSRRLAAVTPAPDRGAVTPPCTAPTDQVAAWWAGLTEAQRWDLTRSQPALVGRLDGVPARDRDQANRLLLQQTRQQLVDDRLAAVRDCAAQPDDAACRNRLDRLDNFITQLDAINGRLQSTSGPRAYLLGIDIQGAGHAIVSLGDPNTADNVVTFVPGMGLGINNMATEMIRADRLVQQASVAAPHERTAAVVWLDYDRPPDLIQAASASYARHAEPALDRFIDGLHSTDQNGATHYTVLGHSYGSTVVGFTARDQTLAADDVIFVGSPGVGVEHAAELNLAADHVWASTADHDAVRAATVDGGLVVDLPVVVRPFFGESTEELWFGANPADAHFGGHVFTSDPGSRLHPIEAHNAYFANGSTSLANIARIVVGGDRLAEVR